MIETNFEIVILKEDLKHVYEVFKKHDLDFPVYFIDIDKYLKIEFVSDYEEHELVRKIEGLFTGYEYWRDIVTW